MKALLEFPKLCTSLAIPPLCIIIIIYLFIYFDKCDTTHTFSFSLFLTLSLLACWLTQKVM